MKIDYDTLLDTATDLGHELAMNGAETFRVEESVQRVMAAYGVSSEVFAIPNCLTVSIETDSGKSKTRMRRIGAHGNDLDSVERFSGLSRAICSQKPEPSEAAKWLQLAREARRQYSLTVTLLGHFLGAGGFAMLFGGGIVDGLCAGLCGLIAGIIGHYMDKLHANQFFRILATAFPMALLAYAMRTVGMARNVDAVIIGSLMLLVPGLLFTNAMRDIIFGDTNSGTNRIVQVLLIAVAIALGTAAAWNTAATLWGVPPAAQPATAGVLTGALPCLIGCIGFAIYFNIHGFGGLLCAFGGVATWLVYCLTQKLGGDLSAFFWGTLVAAAYSEIMARVRKCPAISYLVVAIFPLIPGAGVYYTMRHALHGEMDLFAAKGMHTAAEAGIMAAAILLVSTTVRIWTVWQTHHKSSTALK